MHHTVANHTVVLVLLASVLGCERPAAEPAVSTERSYLYDVHVASKSGISGGQAGAGQQSDFAFELRGTLRVTPLELSPARDVLALSLEGPVLSGEDDPGAKERFARVGRELTQTTLITYERGAMIEVEIGKDLEALTVGVVRNLAAALQQPEMPASSEPAVLTTREHDATGRYVATYTPQKAETGDAAGLVYDKRKVSYEALIADASLQSSLYGREIPPPTIARSTGTVRISGGRVVNAQLQEQLDLSLLPGTSLATRTELKLDARREEPAAKIDRTGFSLSHQKLAAATPYRTKTAQFDFDALKIGGRGFDELLAMLEALAKEREIIQPTSPRPADGLPVDREDAIKRWTGEQNRALTSMAALLRTEPELTARAAQAIRAESPATQVLVSALSAAGTAEAQRELLSIMRDESANDGARNAAGLGLIRTKAPRPETVRALEDLLDDRHWKQHAILGLGTFARLLGEAGDAAEHKRIGELLLDRLRVSVEGSPRRDALDALSNSGYAGMVDALEPYYQEQDNGTRERAVRALRLVKGTGVERVALRALQDAAPTVRMSALDVAESLDPSPTLATAVQRRALEDDNANARLKALQLLIEWKDRMPSVRTTIEQVAAGDPSEPIRQAAQRATKTRG